MRARCSAFRYCPDPLGIVTAKQFVKLDFGGQCPLTMRAQCSAFRHFPDPLGIVTTEQLDKLEFGGRCPLTMRHGLRRSMRFLLDRSLASVRRIEFDKLEFDSQFSLYHRFISPH